MDCLLDCETVSTCFNKQNTLNTYYIQRTTRSDQTLFMIAKFFFVVIIHIIKCSHEISLLSTQGLSVARTWSVAKQILKHSIEPDRDQSDHKL